MSFTTYIETWGANTPQTLVQQMINNKSLTTNTRVVLAFASFNFDVNNYIPGISNMTIDDIKNLTNLVHNNGAKISLSVGGATYPFAGSDLYSKPGNLASNINSVLQLCGFDGVDFDIEDSYSSVPSDFSTQAASLINTLRSLNSALYITLTTPGQAWGSGMYQPSLIKSTINNINAWQPMEYDIWIDSTNTYFSQIIWDINYYITNWGISPFKIILGLMPGNDDMGHTLTLQNALDLTSFSNNLHLQGIMTWDADIDSNGINGNAPYAFTMGIQTQLNTLSLFLRSVLRV